MNSQKEGRYAYCIIGTTQERNFGPVGIGSRGDELLTIGYDDLSMVVSNHPVTRLVVDRDNLIAHEKVIEKVMQEFDAVLPIRFGTIASDADEIRNLLHRRAREFKNLLRDMEHKVELGVKGFWKDMDSIFNEIIDENPDIKKAKKEIQKNLNKENRRAKMEIGKMVEKALGKKKEREAEEIADVLRRISFDHKLNKLGPDEMFMNAAFLVGKGREKEFDNTMNDFGEKYKKRIRFVYAGPLPVFNFVNVVIYPQEWEK